MSMFTDHVNHFGSGQPSGQLLGQAPGQALQVMNPATLEHIGDVPDQGPVDAVNAVDGAERGFELWSTWSPRRRAEVLRTTARLLRDTATALPQLITAESGKTLEDAAAEVEYAAGFFDWFAEEAVRPDGEFGIAPHGDTRMVVSHKAVGISALVTPWNFPAAMIARKVAPALAAGCSAVLKPAAETPLTAFLIGDLLAEAGLPGEVLTIVSTSRPAEVVGSWMDDPRVRKLSFTGSTQVGRHLLGHAAQQVMNVSMELGGNAPFVVCPDVDVSSAVRGAMVAKFRNSGQACTAANRFFVHQSIADQFIAEFGQAISALTMGNGADPTTDVGPLISGAAVKRIESTVAAAVSSGARVSHRADSPDLPGYFYPATLVTDVSPDAALVTEENFGPVAPVIRWSDEEELMHLINASEYGLASYVYSNDLGQAMRLAGRIDAGMVGINRGSVSDPSAPFGGVKQSGIGREGGRSGLREFQEPQYWSVDWPAGQAAG